MYRTTHGSVAGINAALMMATFKIHPDDRERLEMARGRKPNVAKQAEQLANALKFVSVAGTKENEHVVLGDHFAVMFDGQMTAGYPIEEDLSCCPHLVKLMTALNKCGNSLAIAELDSGRLSIKGQFLRAIVPCADVGDMFLSQPDANIAVANDSLKEAFKCCGTLADEKADSVIQASVLLEAHVCTGTDRKVMMQYWHGVDLPPELVIPKIFINAVVKTSSPIVGFGYTPERSVTLWFEDGSWLKTLLYADKWPDVFNILNVESFPQAINENFFKGVEALQNFVEDDCIYFCENLLQSNLSQEQGAQFDVPGLQAGKIFSASQLKDIAPFAKTMDYTTFVDRAMFFGENMRGCLTSIAKD